MNMQIGHINQKPFTLDAAVLVDTRGLITASSGSGKSWLLRLIIEKLSANIQTIVIDPEGEFSSLREKLDVLIVGEGGDIQVDVKSAGLLARKLAETGVSAVLDIYDLPGAGDPWDKRRLFVYSFLRGLMNIPKDLYHPMLIVIDEAHNFAMESPSKSGRELSQKLIKETESPSLLARASVRNLMSAGRKRGIGGLLATQRISKIDKDSIADARNVFIGGTTLDIDQERSGDMLGMSRKDSVNLRDLEAGEFYCYGPATGSREIHRFRSDKVTTTHPKPGQRASMVVPKASAHLEKIAQQFSAIPSEVQQAEDSAIALKIEVQRLTSMLNERPKAQLVPLPEQITVNVPILREGEAEMLKSTAENLMDVSRKIAEISGSLSSSISEVTRMAQTRALYARPQAAPERTLTSTPARYNAQPQERGDLSGPEIKILDAIAWFSSIGQYSPRQVGVAFLAGYTYGGGAFNNPRGSLRSRGLVEYEGDRIRLTEAGKEKATPPQMSLSAQELQNRVMQILPGPEQKILSVLISISGNPIGKEQLAEASGYKLGGAFNNPLGRLRSLGLVEYPDRGKAAAAPVLFLE